MPLTNTSSESCWLSITRSPLGAIAEESGSVMLRVTGVFPGRSVAAVLDISAGAAWKVVPSALSVMANSAGPVLTRNTAVAPLESVEYGAMFGFGLRVTDGFDALAYTTPL